MVGDLIEYYTRLAWDDYTGAVTSFDSGDDGIRELAKRLQRSMDADGAANAEALEASHLAASEDEKQAIFSAVLRALPACESPIEKLILPWLVAQRYPRFDYRPRVLLVDEVEKDLDDLNVAVVPQFPFPPYRADFALAARRGSHLKFVIVECDGKEFHSEPHQVARDQERDAFLNTLVDVLDVVRFTGSQIYRSPKACAAEAAMRLYRCWLKDSPLDHKFGIKSS